MKTINSATEFQTLIQSDKPILIDFYADWCGPCQSLLPTVEKLAKKYSDDIEIVKVNVDHNQDLAAKFAVRSIPALFFIHDGKITESLLGVQTEAVLEQKIQSHLVSA